MIGCGIGIGSGFGGCWGLIIQVEVLGGHSVVRQSVQVTDLMQ